MASALWAGVLAASKPGGGKIYRVLIGPIRDTGDLSSTRDSLRKTGFREIFVQLFLVISVAHHGEISDDPKQKAPLENH